MYLYSVCRDISRIALCSIFGTSIGRLGRRTDLATRGGGMKSPGIYPYENKVSFTCRIQLKREDIIERFTIKKIVGRLSCLDSTSIL